jgi:hypothetical protein
MARKNVIAAFLEFAITPHFFYTCTPTYTQSLNINISPLWYETVCVDSLGGTPANRIQ